MLKDVHILFINPINKSTKVQWVEYISRFMTRYPDLPAEYYGKWSKIVDEWRANQNVSNPADQMNSNVGSIVKGPSNDINASFIHSILSSPIIFYLLYILTSVWLRSPRTRVEIDR